MVQKHISAAIEPFTNWITQKMTESSPFEQITMSGGGGGVWFVFFLVFLQSANRNDATP